ncbi:MAG: hypothetical protein Q8O67_25300 [Deltaproteobacteria bacterium]|nr:hypothetical protein [Deltaproteobacteria bacterium]
MATKKKPAKKKPAKKKPAKKKPAKKKPAKKKPAKKASSSSSKPLYVRLGLKEHDFHIVDAPEGFEIDIPAGNGLGFSLPAKLTGNDAVLAFVTGAAAVKALASGLKKARSSSSSEEEESLLWVAYGKGTGTAASDVNRDQGWDPLEKLGYQGVAVVSVDDNWSALRFRPA